MTANPERGEIEVDIQGVPHVLRPSYEARVAISRLTGKSIIQLAQAAGDGSLMEEDAAIIVTECVKAFGKATGDKDMMAYRPAAVGEALAEAGVLAVNKRLELMLYLAITGGYDAKGNPKAPPAPAAEAEPTETVPASIAA